MTLYEPERVWTKYWFLIPILIWIRNIHNVCNERRWLKMCNSPNSIVL
jgi:hypothetical protein